MTGTLAYILSKKIALGAVSGIQNITLSPTGQLVFNFKNGTTATWQIPLPDDGKDGVSITSVKIDSNNHLICTMSDSSTIDAGELPGGAGGLVQVNKKSDLPNPGKSDTIYLVINEDTIYYWNAKTNQYKPIAGGDSANSIDFMTDKIEFDDVSQTFDLPIDDKTINVYVNGMYLTEDEDYTIDRTVTPNTITFTEVWEAVDICTVTWVKGNISGSGGDTVDNASFATKEDIDNLFTNLPDISPDDTNIYAKKEDIDALFASDISPTPDIKNLATKQDIDNLFK